MRRLMLLIAAGSLWLFLAAVPVFADGGPHVAADNSGVAGIDSDNCAGCHRAHTAQGMFLLVDEGTALCLSCHGATGLGSAVDVESGVQYALGTTGGRGEAVLGYLRGGGFVEARIGSGQVARLAVPRGTSDVSFRAKVPVRTAGSQVVTSAHLPNTGGVVEPADGVVWGNGANSALPWAGRDVEMECGTCHNPHGNGYYRILNPIPEPTSTGLDPFVPAAAGVTVTDAAAPAAGDTRNYTVIQTNSGVNTLYASQVEALGVASTAGDYWRRYVPWNAVGLTNTNDAPNGLSATFTTQISNWCATCHSRYLSQGWDVKEDDAIFTYRHTSTNPTRNCITCHVSHGSNAQMTGFNSATMDYPGGFEAVDGNSRLLKIDNRGTCQACHDPTGTIAVGDFNGPTPNPIVP